MGAERLAGMFRRARDEGRRVFMPYLTAGLPDPETSAEMFAALAAGGADAFEVGIPYSDPLMDGPIIQAASHRALEAGMTLERGFEVVAAVAARTGLPLLAMTYVNPVLRLGAEEFARRLAAAGADGVIIPDLPREEAEPVQRAVEAAGLGMALFAAPTTGDERLLQIVKAEPALIYGVADLGVTGERARSSELAAGLVRRVRALTQAPLVLGVGISTPEQAAAASGLADGVIVGSALVRLVLETDGDAAPLLEERAAEFAVAIR